MDKKQYHSGELVSRQATYMHIDLQQTGVQGIDSWGAWPLEKYQLKAREYSWSFRMRPYSLKEESPEVLYRKSIVKQ